jgi:predicted phosphodiesterase
MGQKTAIISDLHSNIEAVEAVLKDIHDQGIEDIVCLGDLIGYGPNPREVLRHSLQWRFTLRGNHEDALLFLALDFNPDAARAIEWTRDRINDESQDSSENHKLWNFLGDLPDHKQEDGVLWLHASPRHYTKEYVRPGDVADRAKMQEIFSMFEHLCFGGHTHEPGVFTEDMKFYPPRAFAGKMKLADGRKYFVNIGSVGQPRDRDARSCYVVLQDNVVEFRRVEYNFKQTMQKIYQTNFIPRRFGDRLQQGR